MDKETHEVMSDHEEVNRIIEIIQNTLAESKVRHVDVLSALCELTIAIAIHFGVNKPKFFGQMANWWEEFDRINTNL